MMDILFYLAVGLLVVIDCMMIKVIADCVKIWRRE